MSRKLSLLLLVLLSPVNAELVEDTDSLHDGHIHYDQDVWDVLPPDQAIEFLSEQNITRALVSATPTWGAEKLYRENPQLVVPMLRPYKDGRHRYLWFKDPQLKSYLLSQLARVPYRGFGEFHVFGPDVDSKPIEEMIALARERKLVLHPHTKLPGIKILLAKAHDIPVIWAHGGFDVPLETLRELLDEYPGLIIELSLRDGMLDQHDQLTPQWQALLKTYHTRFLTGMDTYKPSRWADLPETAAATRHWLKQLPEDIAADIARNNFDRIFPSKAIAFE